MKRLVPFLLGAPLLALLVLPVVALALRFSPAALGEEAWAAVAVSARTSGLATLALLLFGTPLAYGLSRRRSTLLETLVTLPAVLPPAAAGLALLLALGRKGLVPTGLPFTTGAVVLAQVYVAAPFYVRPLASAFRAVSDEIESAARLDGAGDGAVFRRIALPLVRRPLLMALTLAWARALGEFGATALFAGNRPGLTQTLPLAIYVGFETDLDAAAALSTLLLAVAVGVIAATQLLRLRDTERVAPSVE